VRETLRRSGFSDRCVQVAANQTVDGVVADWRSEATAAA
jgi:hypothetical protein